MAKPVPGVLDDGEREQIEPTFGVDSEQVARDHVISHALAAISSLSTDDVVFFGGTALSRTHLTELRLSEDIDLIALGDRSAIADETVNCAAASAQ
jgi:predicted nucleotidyltransferase component of viral defense system